MILDARALGIMVVYYISTHILCIYIYIDMHIRPCSISIINDVSPGAKWQALRAAVNSGYVPKTLQRRYG